jgi:hypothetical protein
MSPPASARAPFLARVMMFAAAAAIVLLFFAYYAHVWRSFTAAFAVCVQPFCDFQDYYYPMGEAIFRTELPVEGFLYSPFIAILLAVFPPLGLNASLVLWGILQVLSVILYLVLFRRLVPAGLPIQLLFVALVLCSFPLLLNYVGGQVSVFIMVGLLGLLVLYERGHRVAAAALFALAVSFKFYPLIFLAAFGARRDARFLLFVIIACCAFLLVVPSVLLGVGDTFGFYGGLFDQFRESEWVVANPHSQFLPHFVLRMVSAAGHDAHAYLPLLHLISYGVAAANMGLLFLVQRARLHHANLWSFVILFLTIPFVLKTSWPHDFFYLPFAQAFLAWHLLGNRTGASGWRERTSRQHIAVTFFLLLPSIFVSNVVFLNLFDNFSGYGFAGFLFWANLLLLIASYVELLPPALRRFRGVDVEHGRNAPMNRPAVAGDSSS